MATESGTDPFVGAPAPARRWGLRLLLGIPLVLLGLVALYYVGGALWLNTIDDDPDYAVEVSEVGNGSRAVAVTAGLVDREVNQHRWVANDPRFMPGALLDNMPSFQQGMISALSRFTVELRDQIARVRGSSQSDVDLEGAAGRLAYPGDIWIFEWSGTPVQPSSESQYRRAIEDLRRYNQRLALGQATFERRADNLLNLLNRVAADIGGSSAALNEKIDQDATGFLDFGADNYFYNTKGRLYAYYLVLRDLGYDFQAVIAERGLQTNWDNLIKSLREAAELRPWVVMNAPLDSLVNPNHLAGQGFLLLRARTEMREIADILQK